VRDGLGGPGGGRERQNFSNSCGCGSEQKFQPAQDFKTYPYDIGMQAINFLITCGFRSALVDATI